MNLNSSLRKKSPKLLDRNLEVDGCPSKENLFGQFALLINATLLFFPKVIYKFME